MGWNKSFGHILMINLKVLVFCVITYIPLFKFTKNIPPKEIPYYFAFLFLHPHFFKLKCPHKIYNVELTNCNTSPLKTPAF